MSVLAMQWGDWLILAFAIFFVGSAIGGVVKFIQMIRVLRRGNAGIDPELAEEQLREGENHDEKN